MRQMLMDNVLERGHRAAVVIGLAQALAGHGGQRIEEILGK